MTRSLLCWLTPLLFGCTEIPDPVGSVPAQVDDDAGPIDGDVGPYAGPCEWMGLVSARGLGLARYGTSSMPDSVVNSLAFLVQVQSGEIIRFDVNIVGTVQDLRGKVFPLGEGGNADLMTCAHCIVAYRGCDRTGKCESGPHFPSAGRVVLVRMATGPESTFQLEIGRAELRSVNVDTATLHSTLAPDSDSTCMFFENIALNVPGATGLSCSTGYGCAIADTAEARYPGEQDP